MKIEIPELEELISKVNSLEEQIKILKLQTPVTHKEWYNLKEAADYLRLSPRTIMRLIDRKLLSKSLDTWRIRIPRDSLDKYKNLVL